MTAQVLNLDSFRRAAIAVKAPPADEHIPYCVSPARRTRRQMRLAWNKAKFRMDFYHAMAEFALVLESAAFRKDDSFPEMRDIPALDRMAIVDRWRQAVAALIMTPAATVSEIAAKRVLLRSHFAHVDASVGRKAIAADKKWLAKNPYRAKSNKSKKAI